MSESVTPSSTPPTRAACQGCGKQRDVSDLCPAEIGIASEAQVCQLTTGGPVMACHRKAYEKLKRCVGCGGDQFRGPFTAICYTCQRNLELGQQSQVQVDAFTLCPELLGKLNKTEEKREILRCLARLAAAKGPRKMPRHAGNRLPPRGDGVYEHTNVELDEDQQAALLELAGYIDAAMTSQYIYGRKDGRNLLGRLAHASSINDFEETERRWRDEEEALRDKRWGR